MGTQMRLRINSLEGELRLRNMRRKLDLTKFEFPKSAWLWNGAIVPAWKAAVKDDHHPHDLRHTCTAWLVQAGGVSISEVAEVLWHSDMRQTSG